MMKEQSFITAKELAVMLNISTGHAYKVIHRLNDELTQKGYLTFSGRIPRKVFLCGHQTLTHYPRP